MRSRFTDQLIKYIKTKYKYFSSNSSNSIPLKPPWKVLFFGSDEFSVASLNALHRSYIKSNLLSNLEVVTTLKEKKNPVEKFAIREKLIVHRWPISSSVCKTFDVGIVVSFGHLIPEDLIHAFPLGMVNVHASLLPRWRGAAPIIYTIANGDKETGVTVMKIQPKRFDVGDVILQDKIDISDDMPVKQLYKDLADLGAHALVKVLNNLVENLKNASPQQNSGITYAPRVDAKIAKINWNKVAACDVYNLERAVTGLFALRTSFNDIPVKLYGIKKCSDANYKSCSSSGSSNISNKKINNDESEKVVPGFIVYDKHSRTLRVQCTDGKWICVKEVGIPGKRISATDFNNGFLSKQHKDNRIFR